MPYNAASSDFQVSKHAHTGRAICAGLGADAPPTVLKLKENGIIPERIRVLVHNLAGLGLKVTQATKVIPCVAKAAILDVLCDLSERTGGRGVKEVT